MKRSCLVLVLFLTAETVVMGNLIANGDFESGLTPGWATTVWSRTGTATVTISTTTFHSGSQSAHIVHTGTQDWSYASTQYFNASEGDMFFLSGWFLISGSGTVAINGIPYNSSGSNVAWSMGSSSEIGDTASKWALFNATLTAPKNTVKFIVRLTGTGASDIFVDDISLVYWKYQPSEIVLDGGQGSVTARLDVKTTAMEISLKGTSLTWKQTHNWGPRTKELVEYTSNYAKFILTDNLIGTITVTPNTPEIVFTLSADESFVTSTIAWPPQIQTDSGWIILPYNEGLAFPVNDTSFPAISTHLYGGHGLCMAFWGVTDVTSNGPAYMAIIDTPDDAVVWTQTANNLRYLRAVWNGEKGKFGYTRQIRYRFFETGGHVAMCKSFRSYRKSQGLLVTLKQKQARNPYVDLLIGAVNIWSWQDPVAQVTALQNAGIKRILWSGGGSASALTALNSKETVLTSRYDIFQDCMNPENFPNLTGIHGDWTWQGWPEQIVINSTGGWEHGWEVTGKGGIIYACGVLCDEMAIPFAKNRTALELQTKPYRGRFIDTTTASPWRECYSPSHPMTRRQSKVWKMKLLDVFNSDFNMVVGSETGHEAAVPYLHFFEGMMSLSLGRVSDSGRNIDQVLYDVPEQITKYQLGHTLRLPLWELIYHDCVVSYWYWGDYNNKLIPVWDKRDLFNILYGVPPMFMMNATGWNDYKDRFVQSYNNTVPFIRKIGYSEMLSHNFLTTNREVQQTTFNTDEGKIMRIVVNFATAKPYTDKTGIVIGSMSYKVFEAEQEAESSNNGNGDTSKASNLEMSFMLALALQLMTFI